MGLVLHGKQIKPNTVELDRLNLNDYSVGDTVSGVSSAKVLVNKEYVDQVVNGLSPKKAVRFATTASDGNIDLTTGGLVQVDGGVPQADDRILVQFQTNPAQNGVYLAKSTSWVRAEDFDGNPSGSGEIQRGDYVFVSDGVENRGFGFIVVSSGTINGANGLEHNVGVDPINFTVISEAITYVGGDGILFTGATVSANIVPDGGLEFLSGQLRVNLVDAFDNAPTSLFGNGLSYTGGALNVNLSSAGGLSFVSDELTISPDGVKESMIDFGVGVNQVDATSIPIDTTGTYLGTATNIQDALEELETAINTNTLTNGSGTTAAGTAVNLGGALTTNATVTGAFGVSFGTGANPISSFVVDTTGVVTIESADNLSLIGNNISLDAATNVIEFNNNRLDSVSSVKGNTASSFDILSANEFATISVEDDSVNSGSVSISTVGPNGTVTVANVNATLAFNSGTTVFTDNKALASRTGIQYAADYTSSAGATALTLATKGYVDTAITNVTLTNGSGTTASGSSVNLGGALTSNASITGGTTSFGINLGTVEDRLKFLYSVTDAVDFQIGDGVINFVQVGLQLDTFSGAELRVVDNGNSSLYRLNISTSFMELSYNYGEYDFYIESGFIAMRHDLSSYIQIDNSSDISMFGNTLNITIGGPAIMQSNGFDYSDDRPTAATRSGITYSEDYSLGAGATALTLATKGYVDNAVGAVTLQNGSGTTFVAGSPGQVNLGGTTTSSVTLSASNVAHVFSLDNYGLFTVGNTSVGSEYSMLFGNFLGTVLHQITLDNSGDPDPKTMRFLKNSTDQAEFFVDVVEGGITLLNQHATLQMGEITGVSQVFSLTNTSSVNGISLSVAPSTANSGNVQLADNRLTVTFANAAVGGIVYAADYSATATSRSLMDKNYIDTRLTGKSTSAINSLNSGSGPGAAQTGFAVVWNNTLNSYELSSASANISASNGLTEVSSGPSSDIRLGGTLTQNTDISGGASTFDLSFGASTSIGNFDVIAEGISLQVSLTATPYQTSLVLDPSLGSQILVLDNNTSDNSTNSQTSTLIEFEVTDGTLISTFSIQDNSISGVTSNNISFNSGDSTTLTFGGIFKLVESNTSVDVITIDASSFVYSDPAGISGAGITYDIDYTSGAGATNFTLATKKYVDDQITATTLTSGSGITVSSGQINLGGTLTQNTNIDGNYIVNIGNTTAVSQFNVTTNVAGSMNLSSGTVTISNTGTSTMTLTSVDGIILSGTGAGSTIVITAEDVVDIIGGGGGIGSGAITVGVNNVIIEGSGGLDLLGTTTVENASIIRGNSLSLQDVNNDISLTFNGTANTLTMTDNKTVGNKTGIQYAADYTSDAGATALTLATKGYVDSAIINAGLTYQNGITLTGSNLELGGNLIKNTDITGAFTLSLGTTASRLSSLLVNTTGALTLDSNDTLTLGGSTVSIAADGATGTLDLSSVDTFTLTFGDDAIVTDSRALGSRKGLQYAVDYTSDTGATALTLATKGYVDTKAGTQRLRSQINLSPATTNGTDGFDTNITVDFTGTGDVLVIVNNVTYVATNTKVGVAVYFSNDAGVTATTTYTSGTTKLYWNAVVASYDLDNTSDLISLVYIGEN